MDNREENKLKTVVIGYALLLGIGSDTMGKLSKSPYRDPLITGLYSCERFMTFNYS